MNTSSVKLHSASAVYALLCFIALYAIVSNQQELRFATKALPLLWLAFLVSRQAHWRELKYLFVGLIFCALGDFLLEFTWLENGFGVPWFALGLTAFLLAHCCYIAAFLKLPNQNRWLVALPILLWTAGLGYWLWPNLGSLRIPVLLYVSVITVMMWRALCLMHSQRWLAILAATGAVLFGISDSLIAINRFIDPLPLARLLISTSYWLAQWCIAIALILMVTKNNSQSPPASDRNRPNDQH